MARKRKAAAEVDSGSQAASETDQEREQDSRPATQLTANEPQEIGNVPAFSVVGGDSLARAGVRPVNPLAVHDRLRAEGRWDAPLRDRMYSSAVATGMSKEEAKAWTYSELDRLYPPLPAKSAASALLEQAEIHKRSSDNNLRQTAESRVSGLADIPPGWPELPANATLTAEIGWVQSERLRIVDEKPNGSTVVTLSKARSPAPSWSALSWLETSIRSYAKYVEVAAKAASAGTDEQAQQRRERMAIEEIRSLLKEMLVDKQG